eukprot:gnl/Chilomastix_cuspidata/7766.p1 GENE.gnl/Chilomastix_cuspidata/7766~~gnl/Chilomastix_cuspidata/7766.p1  ORF type:complete len:445 (-),score=-14.42 gnl/Chilomastix_cuspidata/7766:15-1349(-)
MKKVLVAALAVALAAVMAVPAGAFENEFGGYWRTRAYTAQDFSGTKNDSTKVKNGKEIIVNGDDQSVDTRTRIYYTAKFSDNFKFVNKFEFNSVWGDDNGGDVGSDGDTFVVKNSYVDFNLSNYNFKIGSQAGLLSKGLIMDDDFSGVTVTGTFGNIAVPVYWIKADEGGIGEDMNDADKDVIVISPEIKSGNMNINPFLVYAFQDKVEPAEGDYYSDSTSSTLLQKDATAGYKDYNAYNIGVNFAMELDSADVWATLVYQGGSYDKKGLTDAKATDYDISAYMVAFGGGVDIDNINVHGQFFYASGDDDKDDKDEAFADLTGGQSYYWSEIMGFGIFDNQASNNSCADKISDIMAFNVGASMSPMEKLTLGADLWYAALAEDTTVGTVDGKKENYLGTELDLSASYAVMENLNLDVVAAYLFAGDATGDEDPYEVGAQLSLSF